MGGVILKQISTGEILIIHKFKWYLQLDVCNTQRGHCHTQNPGLCNKDVHQLHPSWIRRYLSSW